jgi:antitoxin MazE
MYLHCRYSDERNDMKTYVQKWGNSLALRIPKSFASEVGLESESPVEMSMEDGKLVIAPVDKPEFTLKQLLAKITPENVHHEVEIGPAIGNEVW